MQELPTSITLASPEQATDDSQPIQFEGTAIVPQVLPELVEMRSGSVGKLILAASNVFPSVEQAIEDQLVSGELVGVHVIPAFVETYIKPEGGFPYWPQTPAASFVPSAEEAMQLQFVTGAVVRIQLCASTRDNEPPRTTASKRLK